MNLDKETIKKVQELQVLEQNMQGLLMQKQAFQVEMNEANNALEEVRKTKDDIYKVIGNVMLKSDKEKIIKELEEKRKLFEIRVNSIEKQERLLESKAEELRREINKSIAEKKK